jgi:hypothetical protein
MKMNKAQFFIWLCSCLILSPSLSFAQSVVSFTLVDANTDQDIMVLHQGDSIHLSDYPANAFNIRANTQPDPTGSVSFDWNGQNKFKLENAPPYALFGDNNGDYAAFSFTPGTYNLVAKPYPSANGGGTAGTPLSINFIVSSQSNPGGTCTGDGSHDLSLKGQLRQWHKITLDIEGPNSDENCSPNPFLDYRMNVTFSHAASGKSYLVPGFFAGDGKAGESSATGGNVWRCHFAPDETGAWEYSVSFRSGNEIAVSLDPNEGAPVSFDGLTGSFTVLPSDKTGRDFRAQGRLQYVGERYLKFAGSGQYFIKGGADAPENFLAYEDFDNTPNNGNRRKSWSPHLQDWKPGDPQWKNGQGREIIGALNYLASEGLNVFSFLTMNINGDDKNVFPYVQSNGSPSPQEDRRRFDLSKLDQWEIVFAHADSLGLYLHFKTQETENDQLLDQGTLGTERKLYYRELVARFGHHLALNWNLGEENDIWSELNDPNQTHIKSYAKYLRNIDPYNHHIVIHSYPGQQNQVYDPLLGLDSALTGTSIQTGWNNVHSATKNWIEKSTQAGLPWVVANDEQGSANNGVPPDPGYNGFSQPGNAADQEDIRREVLWGNLMAGGAGVEYYFGYGFPDSDLSCENWRSRDQMWDYTRHALAFFYQYLPFWKMSSQDALVSHGYCFAQTDSLYVVYLANGNNPPSLDLPQQAFDLRWYDPRNGGSLQNAASITGGNNFSLPNSPSAGNQDWVLLITLSGNSFPIELGYFTAKGLPDGQVQLSWESKRESNSSHFEIEGSTDLLATESLGQVAAAGFSESPITYSFFSWSQHQFFRLKMVDLDGSYAYSPWVEWQPALGSGKIRTYPNPCQDYLHLESNALPAGSRLQIVDFLGRTLHAQVLEGTPQTTLNVSGLPQGLYLLRILHQEEVLYRTTLQKE